MNGWATVTASGRGVEVRARAEFVDGANVDLVRFPEMNGSGMFDRVAVWFDGGAKVCATLGRPLHVVPFMAAEFKPRALVLKEVAA